MPNAPRCHDPRLTSRRRAGSRLATALAVGLLAAGCADPVAPRVPRVDGPSMIGEVDGKLRVFNVQLRAIDDPNIIPSEAWGHIQLQVTALGDGSVLVAAKGEIFNPAGEFFTGWSLNDLDNGRPLAFLGFGALKGTSEIRIDPEDATIVSAEIAQRLFGTPDTIDDPNLLVVRFYSVEHPEGALYGDRAVRVLPAAP